MSQSKEEFMEERKYQDLHDQLLSGTLEQEEMPPFFGEFEPPTEPKYTTNLPESIEIKSNKILIISRESAHQFHEHAKKMIYDTGYGLFEYLEVVKFFEKVSEEIHGASSANKYPDLQFISYVRDEIAKHEKGKFTSERGVKFENCEVAHKYEFGSDPQWQALKDDELKIVELRKQREEFLKALKAPIDQLIGDEVVKVNPPVKTSKSSFKMTLAK